MSTKDKLNRKIYRDTLKAAAKYFHNREDFEREEELKDELRSFDRIKKKRRNNEE
jgi:hypothetical protein